MDFFYSSDILLKKCFNCWYLWKTAMHVRRCLQVLTEWLMAKVEAKRMISCFEGLLKNTMAPSVLYLWHHDTFIVSSPVRFMISHLKIHTQYMYGGFCPAHIFEKDSGLGSSQWNRMKPSIYQNQPKVPGKEGLLYHQLTWVLWNVKAVKLLLNVMFYTLLLKRVTAQISRDAPWHFHTLVFKKQNRRY